MSKGTVGTGGITGRTGWLIVVDMRRQKGETWELGRGNSLRTPCFSRAVLGSSARGVTPITLRRKSIARAAAAVRVGLGSSSRDASSAVAVPAGGPELCLPRP